MMGKDFESMNTRELRAYAKGHGVTVPFGTNSKEGIIAVILSEKPDQENMSSDFEDASSAFSLPAAQWESPVTEEFAEPEPTERVSIEYTMTGYYVVKRSADGNVLVRVKCETPNQARRERNRLAGE